MGIFIAIILIVLWILTLVPGIIYVYLEINKPHRIRLSAISFPVSTLGGYIEITLYESITPIKNVNYYFVSFFIYLATAGFIIMTIAYFAVELSIQRHKEAPVNVVNSKVSGSKHVRVRIPLETDDEIIKNERFYRYAFILSLIAWLSLYGFHYLNLIPDDFLYSGALLPSAALFTILFFLFWLLYYFSSRKITH